MFDLFSPSTIAALAIILLVSFPMHEYAHAWMAFRLGDDTAARQGRLSLNPLNHLDPLGTIFLITTQAFGWAKPVPVNPMRLRLEPRVGYALVAAAGPASNLLMATAAALVWRAGILDLLPVDLSELVLIFVWINVGLALFNLIPFPPLDGFSVLSGIVDNRTARRLEPLRLYGEFILMALLMIRYVAPQLDILGLVLRQGMVGLSRLLLG